MIIFCDSATNEVYIVAVYNFTVETTIIIIIIIIIMIIHRVSIL
jgi:hypothetical protein